jgi:hypothetical protein
MCAARVGRGAHRRPMWGHPIARTANVLVGLVWATKNQRTAKVLGQLGIKKD